MNRNYQKALLLLGAVGGLGTSASAQLSNLPVWLPGPPVTALNNTALSSLDWVINCEDPKSTTSPYSTDYGIEFQYDSLFGAVMGVQGTVNYSKRCWTNGLTIPVAGRLGFFVGTDDNTNQLNGQANPNYGYGGTNQDRLAGTIIDDGLGLTMGTYSGVGGNWSIAKIFQGPTTTGTTPTGSYFGSSAIDTAYWGASDRYFVCESTNGNVRAKVRVDVIGDAARIDWKFENTSTAAAQIGLWFGQWVEFSGVQGTYSPDYITMPGYRPVNTDTRFANVPVNAPGDPIPQLQQGAYLNIGMYQSWAHGLQVVLQANAFGTDQTQVDSIDVGKNVWLLGSMTATDGAMPDLMISDTTFLIGGLNVLGSDAYIEKWNPSPVVAYDGTGIDDTREIIAYYRGTWSTADYAAPYSVILDAPPVIATSPNNAASFQNAAPVSITVQIDDTRGFSTADQSIPLQDVEVALDLPSGMTDYNNPGSSHMVQYLASVPPQTVQFVTFQVAISPTVFGTQQYTVTITPNPGPVKSVTGSIVVASQPFLNLNVNANLVTAPWQFASSAWNTIIGQSPTFANAAQAPQLDLDYQVFGWDANVQDYVIQTGPQRGYGSFVIWNPNSTQFLGQPIQLAGSPSQAQDIQTGAPDIILQPGWNMIANPYNYAIPLGEIIGVDGSPGNNNSTYTFAELVNLGLVSGYLAYWDAQSQGYQDISQLTDLLQPNTGYWIYVPDSSYVTLVYPPVFQAFIPGLTDPYALFPKAPKDAAKVTASPTWSLQLSARQNGVVDGKAAIGQAGTVAQAKLLSKFKAPIAPVKNAISSAITARNGAKTVLMSQSLVAKTVSSQTWNWQVYTKAAGTVTLTWPNLGSVPENVAVTLVDTATGKSTNLRSISSFSFAGKAQSIHNFNVMVKVGPVLPTIESVTTISKPSLALIQYDLSVNASSTVTIAQNGKVINTIVSNRSDSSGVSSATWNLTDSANRRVKAGIYQVVVTSTPTGGSPYSKSATVVVGR